MTGDRSAPADAPGAEPPVRVMLADDHGMVRRGLRTFLYLVPEIATALFITERTARTQVSDILGKLGLVSRTPAGLRAVDHKLAGPRG